MNKKKTSQRKCHLKFYEIFLCYRQKFKENTRCGYATSFAAFTLNEIYYQGFAS